LKEKVTTFKNEMDVKISEVKDQLVNDIKNSKNEVVEKTTGIQQQLIVQSNELNNIIQSIHQLKTVIVVNQQQPLQQPISTPEGDVIKDSSNLPTASYVDKLKGWIPPGLSFSNLKQVLQQPISTQAGILINCTSSLITTSHFESLREWIPKHASLKTCRLDLVYKGSRDGFQAQTFHQMCDNRSPTINVIKSQTYGRIFGGYTEQTWNHTGDHKKDEKAFLFSLTYNEKYPVANPGDAIYCNNDYSADFGNGADIYICDSSNTQANSSTYFPSSYKCSKFTTVTEESKAYLSGSYQFKVDEIEVYQIVWVEPSSFILLY